MIHKYKLGDYNIVLDVNSGGVHVVDELNIPVIAYGLRADFRGEFFEGSQWLMCWADTIEEVETMLRDGIVMSAMSPRVLFRELRNFFRIAIRL